MNKRLVRVEFEAQEGRGAVDLRVLVGGNVRAGVSLLYPRQGQPVRFAGQRSRHEQIAHELNAAADRLNDKLEEWCS